MTPPRDIKLSDLKYPARTQARLDGRITRGGPDACWLWTGRVNVHGYGRVDITLAGGTGATVMSHRLAYLLAGNDLPAGLVLRHTCDTPRCCNPAHLVPGTQAENMEDRTARRRLPPRHGASNPNARLTAQDAQAIRSSPQTVAELALQYGVHATTIRAILKGTRWGSPAAPSASRPRRTRGTGTKLTQEAVDAIRANPGQLTGSELARRHRVSPSTITLIRQGKIW